MTYQDLLEVITAMSEDERMQTATICSPDEDEYFAIDKVCVSDDNCDVLDPGHLYLKVFL